MIEAAQKGEIDRDEFERRVKELTLAILLLAFLLGSRFSLPQLQASPSALQTLEENQLIAEDAAGQLSRAIYDDEIFIDESGQVSQQSIIERALLWTGTAAALYSLGQVHRADDPFLMWQVGPTEHCSDCLRLDGQVHRASEWLASGWSPRIRRLECGGWRCLCEMVEVDGPSVGSF